jgi:hypothetical protein
VGDFDAAPCYRACHKCLAPTSSVALHVVHLCVVCRRTVCLACCALCDNADPESVAPEDDARHFGHAVDTERTYFEPGQNAVCYPCSERLAVMALGLAVMALGPLARQFVAMEPA